MTTIQDRSLLVLIVDLTPEKWGQRSQHRMASDKARSRHNKRSVGPATLEDTLSSILSFLIALSSCHRDNTIVLIGAAGNEVGVLYPRKDRMGEVVGELGDRSVDLIEMREGLMLGAAEIVGRCVRNPSKQGTSIVAAASLALCIINRFMVSSGNKESTAESLLHRKEDKGILGMISKRASKEGESAQKEATEERLEQRRARGMLSPRMLIVQASDDYTPQYNSFMNVVFAAANNDIIIDGCFIPSGIPNQPKTSTFLEQACDRTGGVFSKPMGSAQVQGGLTEVFMTVFLPPLGIRNELNLPKVNTVDFRARCFETGASLDMGMVCNLCLSIFKVEPKGGYCLTCGAKISVKSDDKSSNGTSKEDSANKRPRLEN